MKNNKVFGLVLIVIGILLILGPNIIVPVCPPMKNGMFMKCHWMARAVTGCGGVVIFSGLLFLVLKDKAQLIGVSILNVAIGIYTILLPLKLIGGCKSPEMNCRVHTMPFIYLIGGIFICANLLYILKNRNNQ